MTPNALAQSPKELCFLTHNRALEMLKRLSARRGVNRYATGAARDVEDLTALVSDIERLYQSLEK